MGCAASSPLARAFNPARFMQQAKEANSTKEAASAANDMPYPIHGVAAGVKERMGAAVDTVEEKVGSTINSISEQVSHAAHGVEAKLGGAMHSVGDAVGTAVHGAEEAIAGGAGKAQQVLENVKHVLPASTPVPDMPAPPHEEAHQHAQEMQELLESMDTMIGEDSSVKVTDIESDNQQEEKLDQRINTVEDKVKGMIEKQAESEIETIHM